MKTYTALCTLAMLPVGFIHGWVGAALCLGVVVGIGAMLGNK